MYSNTFIILHSKLPIVLYLIQYIFCVCGGRASLHYINIVVLLRKACEKVENVSRQSQRMVFQKFCCGQEPIFYWIVVMLLCVQVLYQKIHWCNSGLFLQNLWKLASTFIAGKNFRSDMLFLFFPPHTYTHILALPKSLLSSSCNWYAIFRQ